MEAELASETEKAIEAVDRAIADHIAERPAPLSKILLINVRAELLAMSGDASHTPTYPRFVLDWPEDSDLKNTLIQLAYQYGRQLKRKRP
jgi:hypothetical protein